jgi:hypothetical protein
VKIPRVVSHAGSLVYLRRANTPQSLSLQPRKRDEGCLVDTINATVIKIGNDGDKIYHIVLKALFPKRFSRISINEGVLGGRLAGAVNVGAHQLGDQTKIIAATEGEPKVKVGDSIPIRVFYDDE